MEYETMTVSNLRSAARHFAPETKGVGGLAHVGSKEQLINLLREKGVMPIEVKEFCEASKSTQNATEPEQAAVATFTNVSASTEPDEPVEPEQNQPETKPESKVNQVASNSEEELEIIRRIINRNQQQKAGVDREAVEAIVKEQLDKFRKKQVKVIEVKQANGEPNKVIGVCHKMTQQIADVCNVGIHQMLVGPAGGGGSLDEGRIMSIKESDMKSEYRNGDLVNVKHIGGCRIVKIEKQPDGTMCYLLKKGSKLFSANTSQMVAGK